MTTPWYLQSGNSGDIVISSRVRLARNLKSFAFTNRLLPAEILKINSEILDALKDLNLNFVDLSLFNNLQALALVENHVISPNFLQKPHTKALLTNKDFTTSIMLNEEDHVRIQTFCAGLDLDECFKIANEIDDELDKGCEIAFDENFGYLTECATNLGTGLRAGVSLHLFAIEKSGSIAELQAAASKIGLTIRGAYGEGSAPFGSVYQLSTQSTLNIKEDVAISNLQSVTTQIIEKERELRKNIINDIFLVDKIFRAYGNLKHARVITSDECTKSLSLLRLGVSCKILNDLKIEQVNRLNIETKPANLLLNSNKKSENTPQNRDILRANLLRETLKENKL